MHFPRVHVVFVVAVVASACRLNAAFGKLAGPDRDVGGDPARMPSWSTPRGKSARARDRTGWEARGLFAWRRDGISLRLPVDATALKLIHPPL
jgi:hypothetical protein